MEELFNAVDEIAKIMKEKGYDYFNVPHGGIGVDFKTGLLAYLRNVNITKREPVFPIYAASGVAATDPSMPMSWATFIIAEDTEKVCELIVWKFPCMNVMMGH